MPTTRPLPTNDDQNTEDAELPPPTDQVAALIDAIYVQARTDDTASPDYFGLDTGDASAG